MKKKSIVLLLIIYDIAIKEQLSKNESTHKFLYRAKNRIKNAEKPFNYKKYDYIYKNEKYYHIANHKTKRFVRKIFIKV